MELKGRGSLRLRLRLRLRLNLHLRVATNAHSSAEYLTRLALSLTFGNATINSESRATGALTVEPEPAKSRQRCDNSVARKLQAAVRRDTDACDVRRWNM
jgi:hypothetical protein